MTQIFGILNVTRDSFSDGGRWLEPKAAIERGRELLADGADVLDVGACSTHPDAERVSASEELRRLEPVVGELLAAGARISIDTWQPEVVAEMVRLGVEFINDVTALADPRSIEAVREARVGLVLMHSTSPEGRAVREAPAPTGAPGVPGTPGAPGAPAVLERIEGFFRERLATLAAAGIARERVVLDPGMGFFLSSAAGPSLTVLAHLERLRQLGPVLISTSRKSFLGELTGRPVAERGAATLASELFAHAKGVEYIRTHDARALRDALAVWDAIR